MASRSVLECPSYTFRIALLAPLPNCSSPHHIPSFWSHALLPHPYMPSTTQFAFWSALCLQLLACLFSTPDKLHSVCPTMYTCASPHFPSLYLVCMPDMPFYLLPICSPNTPCDMLSHSSACSAMGDMSPIRSEHTVYLFTVPSPTTTAGLTCPIYDLTCKPQLYFPRCTAGHVCVPSSSCVALSGPPHFATILCWLLPVAVLLLPNVYLLRRLMAHSILRSVVLPPLQFLGHYTIIALRLFLVAWLAFTPVPVLCVSYFARRVTRRTLNTAAIPCYYRPYQRSGVPYAVYLYPPV